MDGITLPDDLTACPGCGGDSFSGEMVSREEMSLRLDNDGSVAHLQSDTQLETRYTSLDCIDCLTSIIEDGEVVQEALKTESDDPTAHS
jgi:hypothetical protein